MSLFGMNFLGTDSKISTDKGKTVRAMSPTSETTFRFQDLPEDLLLYILAFLNSHILSAVARANRRLHALATPILYRSIVLPNPQLVMANRRAAAKLLIALVKNPSLGPFIQHLENAPPTIPATLVYGVPSENVTGAPIPGLITDEDGDIPQERLSNAMRSCVNLRSLKVQTPMQVSGLQENGGWLNFLLEPEIKLKKLTVLAKPVSTGILAWNRYLARVLDIQTSLEHLDFTGFFPEIDHSAQQSVFPEGRMEKWTPNLRTLKGSRISAFTTLLSNERPLERVAVRGVSLTDIRWFIAPSLKKAVGLREFSCYQAPSGRDVDLGVLFQAMPALRIFRVKTSLEIPLDDLFSKHLPIALTSAPCLTEIDFKDTMPPRAQVSLATPVVLSEPASQDQEVPNGQAALLALYSVACPTLETFVFLDGRRWTRGEDTWRLCSRSSGESILA
ncbi:hypothetical protein FRC04_011517 [Tulasnella sp. 424]|nr:hypothetical protein FRC04_011517 [Tulasnella sp. 424]KAG8971661.1 hypothetical protein FRC05_010917 [Tulasnella sp. 425]